ncbi:MAG TPA: helix-turn-helix transcriptional regulator [Kineosporiaceae bacterium]|nr:helix-turn-helix transcriptional regulator [Kineosporiaceae bacterium]
MSEHNDWAELRNRRMAEPGAEEAYQSTRLAYDLGGAIRTLREQCGVSQSQLARIANMTQSAVARFEAGGSIPTVPILDRLAVALGAVLTIRLERRPEAG